mmetsp:Transcript_41462/g.107428  ORF Transcript_41462/g.107428 Transcript_41462/m.107428 type:complete len:251 (-) Transcript_41462:147-899(-)|eukprot:CAMPEP_0113899590 /NCGR_PEP_ID=MMETSP0780_2-20120614/20126_1 /TAXON_ID=652834 /ORGANISM="Palpitomonas bilix" /LENGTH=250 /DNA_ID=CAMNT_0000891795 /DNA_START=301 /DNA_END=1053 /DNA_ORIENTATION=+ /assembly_acc=CAM_ASM_000599
MKFLCGGGAKAQAPVKEGPVFLSLDLLPEDIVIMILRHLNFRQLSNVALVSRDLYFLSRCPSLWAHLVVTNFGKTAAKSCNWPTIASKDFAIKSRPALMTWVAQQGQLKWDTIFMLYMSWPAKLMFTEGYRAGEIWQMEAKEGVYTIGRSRSNNLNLLHDDMVSRQHVEIVYERGHFYVADLESSNGTYVNKTQLRRKKRQRIKDGDEVALGNSKLVFLRRGLSGNSQDRLGAGYGMVLVEQEAASNMQI